MKTGIELITEERQKQIDKHGFTAEHHFLNTEKWYDDNQMQMAAIYLLNPLTIAEEFKKHIPLNWDREWFTNLNSRDEKERIIIAGALIAAELDRLNYIEQTKKLEAVKSEGHIYEMITAGEICHITAKSELEAIQGYCREVGSESLIDIESIKEIDAVTALSIIVLDDDTGNKTPLLELCLNGEGKILEEYYLITTDAV